MSEEVSALRRFAAPHPRLPLDHRLGSLHGRPVEAGDIEQLEHHILVVESVPGALELEELQCLLPEIAGNHLEVAWACPIRGERRWWRYEFLVLRPLNEIDYVVLKFAEVRLKKTYNVILVPR